MAKKTFQELIAESKAIQNAIKRQREELKERKTALATEYTQNMTTEEKQKEVANCEKEFVAVKKEYETLVLEFKNDKKAIKEKANMIKERMSFLNYTFKNSLPKTKNSFVIHNTFLTFNREGIKEIVIDISKSNWQKTMKEELKKQGINGDDRIADNIVYKAQCLLKSNITI